MPKQQVKDALSKGKDVLMRVDVRGAATVKSLISGALMIFLAPPSMGELERRLRFRQTESPYAFRLRIEAAKEEIRSWLVARQLLVGGHLATAQT